MVTVIFGGEAISWSYEWVDGEVCLGGTYFKEQVKRAYACAYSKISFWDSAWDVMIPCPMDDALDRDF